MSFNMFMDGAQVLIVLIAKQGINRVVVKVGIGAAPHSVRSGKLESARPPD